MQVNEEKHPRPTKQQMRHAEEGTYEGCLRLNREANVTGEEWAGEGRSDRKRAQRGSQGKIIPGLVNFGKECGFNSMRDR